MELNRSHGKKIKNPTVDQIYHAIDDIEDRNGSFVILDRDNGFMQVTGKLPSNLHLEYREGGKLYGHINNDLSSTKVKTIFESYFNNSNDWRNSYQWKEIDLAAGASSKNGCAFVLTSTLLLLLLAILTI